MKIAIIYKSLTGNTKLLAESLKENISPKNLVYFGEPKEYIDADLYLIGSWTNKGDCVSEIKDYLKKLKNKRIAFFATAGFNSENYYETLIKRVKENIDSSNQLIDYFYCQGKMSPAIKEKYIKLLQEHKDDKKLQVNLKNYEEALTHPDNKDLNNLNIWLNNILKKLDK